MNSLLQGLVCVSLLLCVVAVPGEALGVNECSKVYHFLRTLSITKYYTESYSVSCGWWQRCTKTRLASYAQYYTEWTPEERTECCDGWRRDRFGRCTMAICDPSCTNGDCVTPDTCQCQPGYTGTTCSRDIDECELQTNVGVFISSVRKCDHMCINSIGSYRCECDLGYILDSDRHTCKDTDECSMSRTHNCEQLCTNTPGSFECNCYEGYTVNEDGATCTDVDKCPTVMDCEQICINTQSGRECACEMGYRNDSNKCYDIDECSLGEHDCSQDCINGDGNFTCACYKGYELGMDGKTCFDIDECAPTPMNCDKIRICNVTDEDSVCSYFNGQIINTSNVELNAGTEDDVGVRLVGGRFASEGRVEVFYGGLWTTVCDNYWDINDAHVVCRQLNYIKAISATTSAYFGQGAGPIHMDNVQCGGNERDIRDCTNRCGQAAWVNCTSELRLVGSGVPYKGTLEVFYNGEWGTVCDDGWDNNDATVVCRQLNFPGLYTYTSSSGYGAGSGPIHMTEFSCTGSENELEFCSHKHNHRCTHSEDVGVWCRTDKNDVRLVGGSVSSEGRVEIRYGGQWGTVCDDSWDITDANVVCRQLGFTRATTAWHSAHFGQGTVQILMDNVECTGYEQRLQYCPFNGWGVQNCGHYEDASVTCESGSDEVRLVEGTSLAGTVEVFYGGYWSTVCGNGWDINDAHAVCRQLHFNNRATRAMSNGTFGSGSVYELTNFQCGGSEARLLHCSNTPYSICQHSQDAGVICEIDKPPDFNCTKLQVCSQTGRKLTCACVEDEEHELNNMTGSTEGPCTKDDPSNTTKIHLCRNNSGEFRCGCVEGFQLIIENNFCQSGNTHNCNEMQYCRNTQGGFDCPCIEGYTRNNETGECDDIDECSTDYMNCPDAQICNTFNNTIFCECLEGSATDCELGNCTKICTGVEVCVNGACSCYQGYFLNADNMPCKGGGCGEMIHECTDMETCNNTIGGYECPCMNGFLRGQGVNATCDDIDECMEETDGCDHLCMNIVGGYSCACVEGFTLLEDRHTCVMPMSLHQAYMSVKEGGTTRRSSVGGWFFPLGMIFACALVAAVVIGRKKSERFRDGTERIVAVAESLRGRITGSAVQSSSQSAHSTGRNGSQLSHVDTTNPARRGDITVDDDDVMGDTATYTVGEGDVSFRGGN